VLKDCKLAKLDEVYGGKMNRSEEEINLSFALNVFMRHLNIILITPVLFGVLVFIHSTYFASKEWEANAIIQVGKVGITEDKNGKAGLGAGSAEPVSVVVARMEHPSFVQSVVARPAFPRSKFLSEDELFTKSFKVTELADSRLIGIKLKSHSPEAAAILAQETVNALREIHEKLLAASTEFTKQKINAASENIRALKAEITTLNKQLKGHEWSSYDATLAATILNDKNTQLVNQLQTKQSLENALFNPAVTYPTQLIGGISISDGPVYPKTMQLVVLAILVGLLVGIIMVFAMVAFKSQEQN